MPFQPGQLAGDYEVLDVLGKGGMGSVYRVRNVISDRVEAMKVLLEDIGSQPGISERFIAEIRTVARLDHPNIAKLHTAFKVQNQLVMVMEFVEGTDLAERAREGSIPLYKVLGYVKQVLSALHYAHNHGVVHRDIKPSNIMVTPQGGIKLMDFGIAKSNAEPLLTRPGSTLGSLLYMSPEQVRGAAVDGRSDIYSLGIVLYELTAGRCPFESDSTYQIMDAQLNATPPPPMEVNRSLPTPLNDIILTALQKDPAHRFQNAEAFRRALESVEASAGTGAQTRLLSDSEGYAPAPATPSTRLDIPASGLAAASLSPAPSRPPNWTPPPPQPVPAATPLAGPPAPPLPAAGQSGARKSHRSVWMAAGAVACLCILAAALIAVPYFRKSAAATKSTGTSGQAAFSTPPTTSPAENSSLVRNSSPASNTTLTPIGSPKSNVDSGAIESHVDSGAIRPVLRGQPKSAPAEHKTEKKPANQTDTKPPEPAPAPAPAPPPGPSQAELNKASESLMKMDARADAVRQGLGDLKQQQASQGLGLRGDIVASENRMNSYLQMAQRALQSRDLQMAEKNMDSAEQELSKLENFLGR